VEWLMDFVKSLPAATNPPKRIRNGSWNSLLGDEILSRGPTLVNTMLRLGITVFVGFAGTWNE
jgi:hypothetical protein